MQIYMVKVGDYMQLIAEKFHIPLYALLRANPQIPDKNKIYPGQVVNIPDTIGPPLPKRPKPTLNVPDLPILAMPIPPSLDPVADQAVIQKVFLRHREGNHPPGENKTDWDSWMPWKRIRSTQGTVMHQPGDDEGAPFLRDGGTKMLYFGVIPGLAAPGQPITATSIVDTYTGRQMMAQWRVIEYRFSKQDPSQGPAYTPPGTTEDVILQYAGGAEEDPPEGE